MLATPAPFPFPGSYALLVDPLLPLAERRAELARILERGASVALIALPLREGAGGNRRVPIGDLLDGTELTPVEAREMVDLARALAGCSGRTSKQKEQRTRYDRLRARCIWSGPLRRQLDRLSARQAKAA